MTINDNCDDHHLLIMVGAQSAEDNHDYRDDNCDNHQHKLIAGGAVS